MDDACGSAGHDAEAAGARLRLALVEPDIAGNVGTMIRLAACFAVPIDIVEPCGFAFGARALKRAGMDYGTHAAIARHADWNGFAGAMAGRRLVALSSGGATALPDARFMPGDVLLMGAESRGLPPAARDAAALAVRIPLAPGMRSLNVAVAAGIALAEALRQTGGFPSGDER